MIFGIVDLETTHFTPMSGFIVEVGIAALDTDTGHVWGVFGSTCREEGMTVKDRDAWIFKNSSLSVDEVRISPSFSAIKELVQHHLSSFDGVAAFNAPFDFRFLEARGVVIEKPLPCAMLAATDVCMIPGKRGGYKWPSVEEAWRHFFPAEPYVEKHRGLDDALHEARIVNELVKLGLMGEVAAAAGGRKRGRDEREETAQGGL